MDELWLEADRPKRSRRPGTSPGSDPDAGDRGRRLVCAHCGARITTDDQRIEVAGKHEHYFVNPDGFDFQIGCFGAAPGVISAGKATDEFTWFPGYTWQLDLCRGCTHHLGWIFRSPKQIFHGLILDRLRDEDDE